MSNREWQVELLWRCSFCSAENKGRDKLCKNCQGPRKATDLDYYPERVDFDARVTDERLIRHAKAGPDWSCRYCNSSQRRSDGECARCGVGQTVGENPPERIRSVAPTAQSVKTNVITNPPKGSRTEHVRFLPFIVGGVALLLILTVGYLMFRTKDVTATVQDVKWEHTSRIERFTVIREEGFEPSGDSFDLTKLGTRYHHTEKVKIGQHQETYLDEKDTYQCGKMPQVCAPKPICTKNNNGFATCKDDCTGGGPKFCPRKKQRSVDDYRDEPRYFPYFAWSVWRWTFNRELHERGATTKTRWPNTTPPQPLARGEEEREHRSASYTVLFGRDSTTWNYHPSSVEEFGEYESGKRFHLKVNGVGGVQVLP